MKVFREAFPSNHAIKKTDAMQPMHSPSKRTKYTFREDYDLDKLPEKERVIRPKGYRWKDSQRLLRHAKHAPLMSKENFFQKIKTYYDDGIQQHEPIKDFGSYTSNQPGSFAGLNKIFNDLYGHPFPFIVRKPKVYNERSREAQIAAQMTEREEMQKRAAEFAHKPYRNVHYPFPEVIGQFQPNEHDGVTYKSKVPLNKIYNIFRQDDIPVKRVEHERLKKFLPPHSSHLLKSVKQHLGKPKPKSL